VQYTVDTFRHSVLTSVQCSLFTYSLSVNVSVRLHVRPSRSGISSSDEFLVIMLLRLDSLRVIWSSLRNSMK